MISLCLTKKNLHSKSTAIVYVVNVSSIASLATLSNKGKFNDRQPFLNTHLTLSPTSNTSYALLTVSTNTKAEHDYYDFLERNGSIYKHRIDELLEYVDQFTGKFTTKVERKIINPLPSDFNKDWSQVEVSTP